MTNTLPLPSPLPRPLSLSLSAPPNTDIWRKPPSTNAFNAPIRWSVLPLAKFKSARVCVWGEWRTRFDQGGVFFGLPGEDGEGDAKRRWVKAGVEFMDERPCVSAVACDRWADWSLAPMNGDEATIQIEREVVDGKPTSTLWVYKIDGTNKRPLREIAWVFEHEEGECSVGVYAAKPNEDEDRPGGELEVHFRDFSVETF